MVILAAVSGNKNRLEMIDVAMEELNQLHSEGVEDERQALTEVVMINSDDDLDDGDGGNIIVDDDPQNKIWYYLDQSGKVQGPFSMNMLKWWKSKGWFASDFRVWKLGQTKEAAILLTDAISQSNS